MSDYNSVAPPQQFNKSQAFAAALQRAKQIAAKINPGASTGGDVGTKRPLDEGSGMDWTEPDAKKVAASPPAGPQRQTPQAMVPGISGGVYTEDIKVPDKMVGLIIGRGGEQITRLQSESGCKIQMAPDSGGTPDRICTLTGNPQAISRAKELVNAIVHQRYKTEGPGGDPPRNDMMPGPPQPQTSHNPSFVEIMLPGPKVGLVIGKGGETIKQLQEKSGAKMVVIQEGPNQEAEKPLRITGDPQKVEHAKALVYELLAEKENQARGAMNRGGGAGRGGFSGGRGPFGQQRGGEEAQYIVPSNKCGVIIGRGGETIKQINQATGAHCELDRRPNNNPNEKIFLIRGAPEQIEAAKQMIAEKLGQGPPGPGGFQPQQQWGGPPQQPYQPPYNQQPVDPNFAGGAIPNMAAAPQADYSQQWIEYYRSLGLHNEADAIEQQIKAKQAAQAAAAAQQTQPTPQPQQNGAAPDYSAQWAQYYRSLGKIKEAESIEHQMKAKQQAQQGGTPSSGAPQPAPQAAAPAAGQAPQFPNYYAGGGFYPGYQYPANPYPGYTPTPQGPAPGEAQPQPTAQQ
nr:far upstream element-binding protein 2 isoform X3 [Halyomorpha halys]